MELAQQWLEAEPDTTMRTPAAPSYAALPAGYTPNPRVGDDLPSPSSIPVPAALATPTTVVRRPSTPKVSRPAATTRPVGGVHDTLLEKGRLYEQRREALRERAVQQEMRHVRGKPHISADAQRIDHRGEPFHERNARLHKQQEERRHFQLEKVERDDATELARLPFRPKISNKGRRATGRALAAAHDPRDTQTQRRQETLESERTRLALAEMQEVRDAPHISDRSKRLASQRRERDGLQAVPHVEAMLERDRVAKLHTWERMQQQAIEAASGNPAITVAAATLQRDGPVGERLYTAAFDAEERRLLAMEQRQQEATRPPCVTPRARSVSRSEGRIEDDLMERHLSSLASRAASLEQERLQLRARSVPAVNPVSDAIAAQLPTSSRERLYAPRASSERATPTDSAVSSRAATPRAPRRELSAREREALVQLEHHAERREERLARLRELQEMRDLAECTFQPEIRASHAPEDAPIEERAAQWAKRRTLKIAEAQQQQTQAEVAPCTFRPLTHSGALPGRSRSTTPTTPTDTEPSAPLYAGDPWGTESFLARQQAARELREERQRAATPRQGTWTGKTTQPQPFQLGARRPVGSLSKPLAPSAHSSSEHQASLRDAVADVVGGLRRHLDPQPAMDQPPAPDHPPAPARDSAERPSAPLTPFSFIRV